MLKEIKIANFRGFSDEVTIRVAPITILIGRNNAGKSSVMKLLRMLKQSIDSSSTKFLVARGREIKLSGIHQQKNVGSEENASLEESEPLMFSISMQNRGSPINVIKDYAKLKVEKQPSNKNPESHTVTTQIMYTESDSSFRGDMNTQVFWDENRLVDATKKIDDDSRFLRFATDFPILFDYPIEKEERSIVMRVLEHSASFVSEGISNIYHVGTGRYSLPDEFYGDKDDFDPHYVGRKGKYTLHHLLRIQQNKLDSFNFVCEHLENILGVKDVTFETGISRAYCNATNDQTGASTNIAEFGFGVHQCLPVLVQGAIMNPHTTMMLEEPEAQIHPTAQLAFSSYFADLWNTREVASIIETHSANMLLRLQTLIKNKELSFEDVSIAYFCVEGGKTNIKNLSIRENGFLEKGLPIEFFHRDIFEATGAEIKS
ncbi:MAG: AAA family ATPase [Pseudohongiellaceae bacterium]